MKKFLYLSFLSLVLITGSCNKDDDNSGSNSLNDLTTGASARDILSDEKYTEIIIELGYPEGFEPPSGIDNEIEDFVNKYCNKPGGITINRIKAAEPARSAYTLQQIRESEDVNRSIFTTGNTLGVYFFFAGGDFISNSDTIKTLGIAYKNTSVVVFQQTIRENSGGLGKPSETSLTASVVKHELGHLMGLVNVGSNMQTDHEDEDHQSHCNVNSCLMYWSLPTTMSLMGGSQPDLDAQCQADLKANGGK